MLKAMGSQMVGHNLATEQHIPCQSGMGRLTPRKRYFDLLLPLVHSLVFSRKGSLIGTFKIIFLAPTPPFLKNTPWSLPLPLSGTDFIVSGKFSDLGCSQLFSSFIISEDF